MAIASNFPNLRPSLLLDFANSQQLDQRITFSRSTPAPYYDGHTSVLAEQNLVKYSQGTGMAANWGADSGGSSTRTDNYAVAPDGTTTAMRFVTTSSPYPNMSQSVSVPTAGTYTLSFYASVPTGTQAFSGGTLSIAGTATTTWQRFTATGTLSAGTQNILLFNFGPTPTAGQELWIWGAQLEQRSAVTAYNATTTSAITNYIPQLLTAPINAPRFDFNPTTGESLGLLIEQSSTNLLTYSQDFTNAAWNKARCSVVANTNIAPDGTQTMQLLVEDTTTNSHPVYRTVTGIVSGTSYTETIYVKPYGRTQVNITLSNTAFPTTPYVIFDINAGSIVSSIGGATGTITSVGNGVYKCTLTATAGASGSGDVYIQPSVGGSNSYTGNGYSGIYIWGAQLEALAFPTSYIATTSAQVTRASDVASMTGTNFSSWWNNGQNTIYASFKKNNLGSNGSLFQVYSSANNRVAINTITDGSMSYDILVNGFGAALSVSTYTVNTIGKVAGIVLQNNYIEGLNGSLSGTGTASPMVTATTMSIGNRGANGDLWLNGWIYKLAVYPQAVTSTNLQALTGS
jgi:hypothetical protein